MVAWHFGVIFFMLSVGWLYVGRDELNARDPVGFALWFAAMALLLFATSQCFLRPFKVVIFT
ncbi:hypothetical protein [Pseudoalteromonas rhizosphaerae]|uniref:Uncharacterized protein n=1 Tax=Pseudoalteromonas rhizosphaerae TaxID=2518973 RepID=A0ABW8KZG4_9GAMM